MALIVSGMRNPVGHHRFQDAKYLYREMRRSVLRNEKSKAATPTRVRSDGNDENRNIKKENGHRHGIGQEPECSADHDCVEVKDAHPEGQGYPRQHLRQQVGDIDALLLPCF